MYTHVIIYIRMIICVTIITGVYIYIYTLSIYLFIYLIYLFRACSLPFSSRCSQLILLPFLTMRPGPRSVLQQVFKRPPQFWLKSLMDRGTLTPDEQSSKPLLVDDWFGDYTIEYFENYHNQTVEWNEGCEQCSDEESWIAVVVLLCTIAMANFWVGCQSIDKARVIGRTLKRLAPFCASKAAIWQHLKAPPESLKLTLPHLARYVGYMLVICWIYVGYMLDIWCYCWCKKVDVIWDLTMFDPKFGMRREANPNDGETVKACRRVTSQCFESPSDIIGIINWITTE